MIDEYEDEAVLQVLWEATSSWVELALRGRGGPGTKAGLMKQILESGFCLHDLVYLSEQLVSTDPESLRESVYQSMWGYPMGGGLRLLGADSWDDDAFEDAVDVLQDAIFAFAMQASVKNQSDAAALMKIAAERLPGLGIEKAASYRRTLAHAVDIITMRRKRSGGWSTLCRWLRP